MDSRDSPCLVEEWWGVGFEEVAVEEEDVENEEDEVAGFLGSLDAVFWLVKEGFTEPIPTPFFSESWVEEFLRSSLVSCILDTPVAPVAPEILVVVPLKTGVLAPMEDEVLVEEVLPSCLEDDTLVPEPNLPG